MGLNILKVNAEDFGGGANQIATSLLSEYNKKSHIAKLFVREKNFDDPKIIQVPNEENRNIFYKLNKILLEKSLNYSLPILPKVFSKFSLATEPIRKIKNLLGFEDFNYPGTNEIISLFGSTIDVIHCHNLHSNFFDLREIISLSKNFPVFVTLHDCWMLTGHCVYPYECQKWKKQCNKCPYPSRPIQTTRDACKQNQMRKKKIYQRSNIHVSAPSKWLLGMAKESILAESCYDFRHIPNGVNEQIFHTGSKNKARKSLGLPMGQRIVLFIGNGASNNPAKGFNNLLNLVNKLSSKNDCPDTLFIVLGDQFPMRQYGKNIKMEAHGWISSKKQLVKYFQASDLYLHLANAENFPTAIIEAMHCNLPIIGSKIGGIPEQIKYGYNGFYFENKDIDLISECFSSVINNDHLLKTLGKNSKTRAMDKFTLSKMTNSYLEWFQEVIERK
jgi:glycosyltransferase involved in cell wall biosynthesis